MKKAIDTIIAFLKKLFSNSSDVGSKRVVGFGSFLLFAAMVIVHLCTKQTIQGELIIAVVAIISACFGLNAMISMKQLAAKSDVASDIVKSDATPQSNEAAKDVLSAEKP